MDWYMVLNDVILRVVQAALLFGIAYLANIGRKYLDKRFATEDEQLWREKMFESLALGEEAAKRAVTVTTQTYVDEIRKAGKWDKSTGKTAFELAMMHAKETLTKDTIEIIEQVTGNAEAYLAQLIEKEVKKQKDFVKGA